LAPGSGDTRGMGANPPGGIVNLNGFSFSVITSNPNIKGIRGYFLYRKSRVANFQTDLKVLHNLEIFCFKIFVVQKYSYTNCYTSIQTNNLNTQNLRILCT